MPPKKRLPSKPGKSRTEVNVRAAIASGRSAANDVIAFRAKQRRKRVALEKKMPARRLEKLLRDGKVPRAVLLSGGGNDIAGDEFAILLNHSASTLPPLNEDIVRGVIEVRLKEAYASIISGLTAIAKSYLGRPILIIIHGYDYPVPDGRGFLGGWWQLPGPWLKPGFQRKGHDNLAKNTLLIAQLIDRFNTLLAGLSTLPEFAHVHYLDLRGTLKNDGTYKKHWANELHPNATGFDLITRKFADAIDNI